MLVQSNRCGLQVWLWLGAHFGTLAIILAVDSSLRLKFTSVTRSWWSTGHVYAFFFALFACAFLAMYRWLYASDPGFLRSDSEGPLAVQLRTAGQRACTHCGCRPTQRSKHSTLSGLCVHRFDHSCWILATDIGDRTHGVFTAFCAAQLAWTLWGLRHLSDAALGCALHGARSADSELAARCSRIGAGPYALAWLALSWTALGAALATYLLVLHVYLLLTNQTTYEVTKGPRCSYLAGHFRGSRTRGYALPAGLPRLMWDDLRGRGPPKPFSQGWARNLASALLQRWPRQYEPTRASIELSALL